ncbi:helix-turn-helix domain-containing protein [Nocardioides sp.]|uniref:helix-turn-helix domain-containing protein n=1 Tax=Nocardioides sp. TaxID=35761 RepID=UPI0039C9C4BD
MSAAGPPDQSQQGYGRRVTLPHPEPLAYTVDDAARVCGVSREMILRAIRAGNLPAKRTHHSGPDEPPRGKHLIMRSDLEAWLSSLPDAWAYGDWGL